MITRFENLLGGHSFTKNLRNEQIDSLKARTLWSVDDEIYWVNKVIHFESHVNVLLTPLYAWRRMISNNEWSVFDLALSDKIYSDRLTDKLCIRHEKAEIGLTDKSGNALYIRTLKFRSIPPMKCGDVFIFDEIAYVVVAFEMHKRVYGDMIIDRVAVVTHEVEKVDTFKDQTVLVKQSNPLQNFIGVIENASCN